MQWEAHIAEWKRGAEHRADIRGNSARPVHITMARSEGKKGKESQERLPGGRSRAGAGFSAQIVDRSCDCL